MPLPPTLTDGPSKPVIHTNGKLGASTRNASSPQIVSLGDVSTDEFPPFLVNFTNSTLDPEIESMYGPFEDPPIWAFPQHTISQPSSPRPASPIRSPQVNNHDDISMQISKLKALIQEREREKLISKQSNDQKQSTKATITVTPVSAPPAPPTPPAPPAPLAAAPSAPPAAAPPAPPVVAPPVVAATPIPLVTAPPLAPKVSAAPPSPSVPADLPAPSAPSAPTAPTATPATPATLASPPVVAAPTTPSVKATPASRVAAIPLPPQSTVSLPLAPSIPAPPPPSVANLAATSIEPTSSHRKDDNSSKNSITSTSLSSQPTTIMRKQPVEPVTKAMKQKTMVPSSSNRLDRAAQPGQLNSIDTPLDISPSHVIAATDLPRPAPSKIQSVTQTNSAPLTTPTKGVPKGKGKAVDPSQSTNERNNTTSSSQLQGDGRKGPYSGTGKTDKPPTAPSPATAQTSSSREKALVDTTKYGKNTSTEITDLTMDTDSDMIIDEDDPEYADYIAEQQMYDKQIAELRSRIEKRQQDLEFAQAEKVRLQAYSQRKRYLSPPPPSSSSSLSSKGDRLVVERGRKSLVSDTVEETKRSRKRRRRERDAQSTQSSTMPPPPRTRRNDALQNQLLSTKLPASTSGNQRHEPQTMPSGSAVGHYFTEFSDLVRNRAVDHDTTVALLKNRGSAHSPPAAPSPQIQQLVTLDGMTFTCESFRLPEASKYSAVDTTQFKPQRYHESTLLAMLIDGVPRPNVLPSAVMKIFTTALGMLPKGFKDQLTTYDHGMVLGNLDSVIEILREGTARHTNVELLWIVYTELMIYRHGYSQATADAVQEALRHHPHSLEILWQSIFSVPVYSSRSRLVNQLLKDISCLKSNPSTTVTPATISEQMTEVLLRTLRFDGLRGVLDQLLQADDTTLDTSFRLITVTFRRRQLLPITDHDLCFIWLCIITFYVFGRLPNDLNRIHWFERVTKQGHLVPSANPLFVVDWSKSDVELDKVQQTVVVTVLLELLRYFCTKALDNVAKKPLLIAVWRNLIGLLEILDCYGRPASLVLLRRNLETLWKIKTMQPELADMIFELEKKIHGSGDDNGMTMDSLCKPMPITGPIMARLPMDLFMAYKAAMRIDPRKDMGHTKLLLSAWRLGRPLWHIYNHDTIARLERMKAMGRDSLRPTDSPLAPINYLCGLYSSALGVTDTFEILQVPNFSIVEFREMPIAWINALFIHLIHFWQTNDHFFMDSFLKEASVPWVLDQIASKEGRVLFHRFKKDCATLLLK